MDAVNRSVDPLTKEIQVFKFLNNLYNSAREFERMSTETQIHSALKARIDRYHYGMDRTIRNVNPC